SRRGSQGEGGQGKSGTRRSRRCNRRERRPPNGRDRPSTRSERRSDPASNPDDPGSAIQTLCVLTRVHTKASHLGGPFGCFFKNSQIDILDKPNIERPYFSTYSLILAKPMLHEAETRAATADRGGVLSSA